ncbi:dual specificity protein phosphatase 12 [Echinococcus multilocularis]|uniref:protein-tyrosine-phosphatase n=1 Tax=Echinococcus multilocularis TaxID=6211 RepID=A0A068Y685_ECHMU|nr:dual specificity protein phosphatase 12 [Echinococcus multilocularis]
MAGLWLGSRPDVSKISTLHCKGIKAILTVDLQSLPLPAFSPFKRLYIPADDTPYENLLKSFEKAITFIEENIRSGVLVHWSATIVIAYLMWRFRMPFGEAYENVLRSRRVSPNDGFVSQLKCFEKMNFTYDPSSEAYKEFQSQYGNCGLLFTRKFFSAYLGAQIHMHSPFLPAYYSCRLCRNPVFHSDEIISHNRPPEKKNSEEIPCREGELFTEYLEWMNNLTCEIQGKLYCTRCLAKLGSYNWCGERCTCGKWITPAFHFARKHLDEIRSPSLTMTPATQRLGATAEVDETAGSN